MRYKRGNNPTRRRTAAQGRILQHETDHVVIRIQKLINLTWRAPS